jgi:hypothetical protein
LLIAIVAMSIILSFPMRFDDLIGIISGRLTVTANYEKRLQKDGRLRYYWQCICSCGKTCWVIGWALRSKHIVSCGCQKVEALATRNRETPTFHLAVAKRRTHGQAGRKRTQVYDAWKNMKTDALMNVIQVSRGTADVESLSIQNGLIVSKPLRVRR